jgi:hypothetical protein
MIFLLVLMLCCVGIVVGIVAIVKRSHRTVAWIGIALHGLPFLFVIALMNIGICLTSANK